MKQKIIISFFFILSAFTSATKAQLIQQNAGGAPNVISTHPGGIWGKLYNILPKKDTLNNPAVINAGAITVRPQDTTATDFPPIYMSNSRFWFRVAGGGTGQGIDTVTVNEDSTLYIAWNGGNQIFSFSTLMQQVKAGINTYFTMEGQVLVINSAGGSATTGNPQWAVLDSLSTTATLPPDGSMFLVGGFATGLFSGHENHIATYDSVPNIYTFDTADIGDLLYNANTGMVSQLIGGVWTWVGRLVIHHPYDVYPFPVSMGSQGAQPVTIRTNNTPRITVAADGSVTLNDYLTGHAGTPMGALQIDATGKIIVGSTGDGALALQGVLDLEGGNAQLNKGDTITTNENVFIIGDLYGGRRTGMLISPASVALEKNDQATGNYANITENADTDGATLLLSVTNASPGHNANIFAGANVTEGFISYTADAHTINGKIIHNADTSTAPFNMVTIDENNQIRRAAIPSGSGGSDGIDAVIANDPNLTTDRTIEQAGHNFIINNGAANSLSLSGTGLQTTLSASDGIAQSYLDLRGDADDPEVQFNITSQNGLGGMANISGDVDSHYASISSQTGDTSSNMYFRTNPDGVGATFGAYSSNDGGASSVSIYGSALDHTIEIVGDIINNADSSATPFNVVTIDENNVWKRAAYSAPASTTKYYQEVTSTAGQTTFSFTTVPITSTGYMVYINGAAVPKTFYSVSGNDIIFATGLVDGDSVILQGIQ